MARNSHKAYRSGPAQELLLKGERSSEEADGLIAVLEDQVRTHLDKLSDRDPEIIDALRRRFGVNFLWNIDARRRWRAATTAASTNPKR